MDFLPLQGLRYYKRRRVPPNSHPGGWQNSPGFVQNGAIYCPPHNFLQQRRPWQDVFAIFLPNYQLLFHSHFWKVTSTCSSWVTEKCSCKMSYSITCKLRMMEELCELAHTCITEGF